MGQAQMDLAERLDSQLRGVHFQQHTDCIIRTAVHHAPLSASRHRFKRFLLPDMSNPPPPPPTALHEGPRRGTSIGARPWIRSQPWAVQEEHPGPCGSGLPGMYPLVPSQRLPFTCRSMSPSASCSSPLIEAVQILNCKSTPGSCPN